MRDARNFNLVIHYICFDLSTVMTVKGVLLFLLLLLSGGPSFAFSAHPDHLDKQEVLAVDSEFEEEFSDLYEAVVPSFRTIIFIGHQGLSCKIFSLQYDHEAQSQSEYLKRSREIIPGLDVPDIIFPFHNFL